jgi:hypothetical protein
MPAPCPCQQVSNRVSINRRGVLTGEVGGWQGQSQPQQHTCLPKKLPAQHTP